MATSLQPTPCLTRRLPIQTALLKPGLHWTRTVLDDFGPLNDAHIGSVHQVVCADIDGDGKDELLVALMGSDPPDQRKTGVWCYKREYTLTTNDNPYSVL
jgi:hypothetical protein